MKDEPGDFIETNCHWIDCNVEFMTQDDLVKVSLDFLNVTTSQLMIISLTATIILCHCLQKFYASKVLKIPDFCYNGN